jgi:alpha-beta hydrolase superfamily lysophospholipase
MGTWMDRAAALRGYFAERRRHGLPEVLGPLDGDVIFILDGVGGFQLAVLMVRRALRQLDAPIGTILVRWQVRPAGQVLADLMWLTRNRRKAVELAEQIRRFHDRHPAAAIHLLAYSGGAGVAVFAAEALAGQPLIETLIVACPAISPQYNLAPALRAVRRAYALVSDRDRVILGAGTYVFGTTDRVHAAAAGCRGFRRPADLSSEEVALYDRFREIRWTCDLARLGHHGGHTGWGSVPFLREHLLPLLRGQPQLPVHPATPMADG